MRKSNEEVIVELMNYSKSGALIQAFVLEGLRRYSQQVVNAQPGALANGLISEDAWRACAQETLNALDDHFGPGLQETDRPSEASSGSSEEGDENLIRFALTITGWVNPNEMPVGEAEEALRQNLEDVTQRVMGDGLVTGSTPMTIDRYQESLKVEFLG